MEERKLNEKESLELIAQMIQNTKNRLETNCGMPFLFWGYTTIFVSLLVSGSNYPELLLAIPMVLTPHHRRNRNLPFHT